MGGKKLKPPKNPWAFNETPQNSWTQKLTPKTSHAEFPSLKNFQKASNDITLTKNNENYLRWPGYMGTTTNLRIVLNTPKNPYLIIKLPKNFLPKKIQELKISRQAPQNRLIIPVT